MRAARSSDNCSSPMGSRLPGRPTRQDARTGSTRWVRRAERLAGTVTKPDGTSEPREKKNRTWVPVALVIVVACRVFADVSEEFKRCDRAGTTQQALNGCAREEESRVEAQLNAAYRALLVKAEGEAAVDKVKTMQRTWLAFRDAYMAAMFPATDKFAAYGSVFPSAVSLRRAELSRQQIGALEALIRQYEHQPR
jgi:uncharacterized protein YecT (DUF1311 family)